MENHNFAAKRPTDFLGDLPEFNFAEDDIGGDGLNLQFFNFSPNYLNPLAGLENNWLASPWPRGAAATTPQDHLNLRLAMQPTAVLLNSAASPKQRGIARNLDAFSPRGAATTPQRKLPAFPLLGPPSRATVGTQTSPGLECNAHFYGKTKPAAKAPQSFATEPIAGNKNHNQRIKKRNTFSQQGASLPPLPKKAKKVAPAVAVTSRLSSQPSSALSPINNNAPAVHEITGTSLPLNARIPSRGAKALTLAKSGPSTGAANTNKKDFQLGLLVKPKRLVQCPKQLRQLLVLPSKAIIKLISWTLPHL